jgi:hypothetical protein
VPLVTGLIGAVLVGTGAWAWRKYQAAAAPDEDAASVAVRFVDGTGGATFRICNNGYRPVTYVAFSAGGSAFTTDTVLAQAHCADVTWPGSFVPADSAAVVVTRVERDR